MTTVPAEQMGPGGDHEDHKADAGGAGLGVSPGRRCHRGSGWAGSAVSPASTGVGTCSQSLCRPQGEPGDPLRRLFSGACPLL